MHNAAFDLVEELKKQAVQFESNVILNLSLNHVPLSNTNAMLIQASGMAATIVTEIEFNARKEEAQKEIEFERSEAEYRQTKIDKAHDKIINNIENEQLAFSVFKYLIDHYGISAMDICKSFPRSVNSNDVMKAIKDLEQEELIYQTDGAYYNGVI